MFSATAKRVFQLKSLANSLIGYSIGISEGKLAKRVADAHLIAIELLWYISSAKFFSSLVAFALT